MPFYDRVLWMPLIHIILAHTMKDFFKCTVSGCSKMYVNKAILKRHFQAFHNTSNKFQCKTCNKSLASRQNLKEHSFIHSGEKPYSCKESGCGASFRQGTHLSAHKKLHKSSNWRLDLFSLMAKNEERLISENKKTVAECIILPCFRTINELPVLPKVQ